MGKYLIFVVNHLSHGPIVALEECAKRMAGPFFLDAMPCHAIPYHTTIPYHTYVPASLPLRRLSRSWLWRLVSVFFSASLDPSSFFLDLSVYFRFLPPLHSSFGHILLLPSVLMATRITSLKNLNGCLNALTISLLR